MPESIVILAASLPWLVMLCYYDWRYRRLPNALTLGMAAIALTCRFGYGGLPMGLQGLLGGVICGLFLLIPFALKGAGGGDVKMLFAVGCLCGIIRTPGVLLSISCAGVILAIVMLLAGKVDGSRLKHACRSIFDPTYDRAAGRENLPPRSDERVRLPFGIAIALGTTFSLILDTILIAGANP